MVVIVLYLGVDFNYTLTSWSSRCFGISADWASITIKHGLANLEAHDQVLGEECSGATTVKPRYNLGSTVYAESVRSQETRHVAENGEMGEMGEMQWRQKAVRAPSSHTITTTAGPRS